MLANALNLLRNGAVGFIDLLDFRALLADGFIIKFTLAIYDLPAAHGTPLYVAAEDVKLAFPDAAVVARMAIDSPIFFLLAITNAVEILATDSKRRLNRVVHYEPINLTRIRRHFVIYFCLHKGKCPLKGGSMAKPALVQSNAPRAQNCSTRSGTDKSRVIGNSFNGRST